MEFWGIEVKRNEPFKFSPAAGMVLHLSQASLGELKKEKVNEPVYLYVKVDGQKLVIGTLSAEKLPQQQFDLVFDRELEISHSLKSGSVYFYGYLARNPTEDGFPDFHPGFPEEVVIPSSVANVPDAPKPEEPVKAAKPSVAKGKESAAGKQKVKIVEPKKVAEDDDDDDSSDEDSMSEGDEDVFEGVDDSDDSEDESAESDDETPMKAETSKKRPAESAMKTPVQDKKAKLTPQKTDVKKVVHIATPYPTKQTAKAPATNKPKSAGTHPCKSCERAFASDKALESHSKAKHAAK